MDALGVGKNANRWVCNLNRAFLGHTAIECHRTLHVDFWISCMAKGSMKGDSMHMSLFLHAGAGTFLDVTGEGSSAGIAGEIPHFIYITLLC